jgi:hypothetical protein
MPKKKNRKKNHPSDYLNDLEEWGENQYNPGYWTGGNIPPHVKRSNRLGVIVFLSFLALSTLVSIVLFFIQR